jgi:hypothetical protein
MIATRRGFVLLGIQVLWLAGCTYGPEHIPMLQSNRDARLNEARAWDAAIHDVETRFGLARSPGIEAALDTDAARSESEAMNLEAKIAALREENRKLRARLDELEEPWFHSLPPTEQVEWRIHRDLLRERAEGGRRPARGSALELEDGPAPGADSSESPGLQEI